MAGTIGGIARVWNDDGRLVMLRATWMIPRPLPRHWFAYPSYTLVCDELARAAQLT